MKGRTRKKIKKSRAPVLAAGGIVLRGTHTPRVAIVQLRKNKDWVLPKGKLGRDENARAAARREVLEETGHNVSVHEFLGAMAYDAGGRPKIVQFWRMQAGEERVRELMKDVRAVQWLPLGDAIAKLSQPREREFLRAVGPLALKAARHEALNPVKKRMVRKRPVVEEKAERIDPKRLAGQDAFARLWNWLCG